MAPTAYTLLRSCEALILLALVFALAGCRNRNEFEVVEMFVRPKPEVKAGETAQIGVYVKNPPPGVKYRWRATRGKCNPQSSSDLVTTYTAPSQQGEDQVTLEVLADGKTILAQGVIVKVIAGPAATEGGGDQNRIGGGDSGQIAPALPPGHQPAPIAPQKPGPLGQPTIRILTAPSYNPLGGGPPEEITGVVSGVESERFRVVVYALTDYWYVQPLTDAPFTDISQDGSWSTHSHLGTKYAALLVRPSFNPPKKTSNLPGAVGDVVAVITASGRK
ncbi:MAG: hypothetical protein HONDAALG_02629 [Gammaproteobacteria bacterium]|nr:hypothetical protein [Gammaproteobacteria bacterium]